MKERRSKRYKAADGKRNEKETVNDEENSDYEGASNSSESGESNSEKTQRKRPKRGQRRSTRKVTRKSLCELSDKEDIEAVESDEKNVSKKESGRRSAGTTKCKNNSADGDGMNGEKVQIKRDLRASTKAVEYENETEVDGGDKNENKDEEEQVDESEKTIKLGKKGSKRKSSSRPSETKKLKDDDNEKNGEPNVCPEETESSVKGKKGETKKSKGKGSESKDEDEDEDEDDDDDDEEAGSEEYEVEKLIDIYFKRNGKREFLVRWKGYSSKDDTWEPEKHLNCKELIDAFLEKCEKAKSLPIREMRSDRRKTDRYIINEGKGRKLSARLKHKPRKTYFDVE